MTLPTGIFWLDVLIIALLLVGSIATLAWGAYALSDALSEYTRDLRTPEEKKADRRAQKQARARERFEKKYGKFPL